MTTATLSKYFQPSDFTCSCCKVDLTTQEAKDRLLAYREKVGIPMIIDSSYRCEKHNTDVGGAKDSQHVHGTAFDIRWSHLTGAQKHSMLKVALEMFTGVGLHKAFIHLDVRRGDRLIWFY